MTRTQRTAMRKRKDRNQRIWWYVQDIVGVACLFGIGYALLFIPLVWSIS
jgi:hypothetical protein